MEEKFSGLISLVFFTALLPVAIGIETGITIAYKFALIPIHLILIALYWSLGLTVLSAIIAASHLGHIERGFYALRGISHSGLSREAVLSFGFGLFLFAGTLVAYKMGHGRVLILLLGTSCLFGLLTIISIGALYNLPSQITWRGDLPSLGMVTGTMLVSVPMICIISRTTGTGLNNHFFFLFTILSVFDIIITAMRWRVFGKIEYKQHILQYPEHEKKVGLCYGLKLVLLVIGPVLFFMENFLIITVSTGILMILDRAAFYTSEAKKTPRVNMAIAKKCRMKAAVKESKNSSGK